MPIQSLFPTNMDSNYCSVSEELNEACVIHNPQQVVPLEDVTIRPGTPSEIGRKASCACCRSMMASSVGLAPRLDPADPTDITIRRADELGMLHQLQCRHCSFTACCYRFRCYRTGNGAGASLFAEGISHGLPEFFFDIAMLRQPAQELQRRACGVEGSLPNWSWIG